VDAIEPGAKRPAPSPPPSSLLFGHAPEVTARPLECLSSWSKLGEVVRLRLGPYTGWLLREPEHIKRVLLDNARNYEKQGPPYPALRLALGDGLVSSEGALWRRQRRLMQPAFHRQRIAAFADVMVRQAEAMLARWQARHGGGEAFDVAAEITRLTQLIVAETLLGSDVSEEAEVASHAFAALNESIIARNNHFVPLPLWIPTAENRQFVAVRKKLWAIVDSLIARRRAERSGASDLLSLLLEARDEDTGEAMSDEQLRAEAMTIYFAGHETTATALAWTFLLLAQHPEAEERLRAELAEVLGGRSPAFADLERLRYTRMVIEEAMRLYPPVWALSRTVAEDDVIGGQLIRGGRTVVFITPWVTHRLPHLWERPEEFLPERFAPELVEARHRFAYFPFLGGPRQCIGNGFALMEAQLVVATVVQRCRLRPIPGLSVEIEPLLTLRPKRGLPMTLTAA
jgi:cytochrome P450